MIGLADRWHKLPSEVLAEPYESYKMLELLSYAYPPKEGQ